MTNDADDSQEPQIDARGAQGAAFHSGSGDNNVTTYFHAVTRPSVQDLLDSIDSANQAAAYKNYDKQDPGMKRQLLAKSCWGDGLFRQDFDSRGAEYCAGLLHDMRVDQAEKFLAILTDEDQKKIFPYLVQALANEEITGARPRVAEWADSSLTRAAQLLGGVAWLQPTEAKNAGPRAAIELLPRGPSFLLTLSPEKGAWLMRLLLPQPGAGQNSPLQQFADSAQVDAFLSLLAEIDPSATAAVLMALPPEEAAGYLSRLRLIPSARLLARYLHAAPAAARGKLLQELPRPMSSTVLKYIRFRNENFLPAEIPISELSGWPLINATLVLLLCLGPGVARLTGSGEKLMESARREVKNLGHVWCAARLATKDLAFYRRQRNELAVVAVFTFLVLLLVIFL